MSKEDLKEVWKKVWNFIWHEDSVWSWIVSLILAFIIVKFIFFPLLSLIFASPLPLVVVESGSMHHPGSFLGNIFSTQTSFNEWWTQSSNWYLENNINKEKASSWKLRTGLEIGDIVLISGRGTIKVGDIIVFQANQVYPIIHRVINITEVDNELVYSTKGDNNPGQLSAEKQIKESQILGKALFRLPKIGWIKLFFVKLFS